MKKIKYFALLVPLIFALYLPPAHAVLPAMAFGCAGGGCQALVASGMAAITGTMYTMNFNRFRQGYRALLEGLTGSQGDDRSQDQYKLLIEGQAHFPQIAESWLAGIYISGVPKSYSACMDELEDFLRLVGQYPILQTAMSRHITVTAITDRGLPEGVRVESGILENVHIRKCVPAAPPRSDRTW